MTAADENSSCSFLPKTVNLPGKPIFFDGKPVAVQLGSGLHVFVGPNGAGKTEILRSLRDALRKSGSLAGRKVVFLSAGRGSVLERFRSADEHPGRGPSTSDPAAVGHYSYITRWWEFEAVGGMFLRLKDRPDLLLKVEARLQALHQRRLRLEWAQTGLQIGLSTNTGGGEYYANVEASGLIQLIPLLAAVYDDGIGILLVDEPEISMHPQLQAFLLQEMEAFAGDPTAPDKKLILIATHSATMLPVRRIRDIPQLVFFTDRHTKPIQIDESAGELKNAKLGALVARLSENHKLAFFSRTVLLVEGPSDEIVVSGLSLKLGHPLIRSNTQVVPVTGKGQFAEAIKFFRMMGKHVCVLADLDALADDNRLVNIFHEAAETTANASGVGSLMEIDRGIREKLDELLDKAFSALPSAATHRYWTTRSKAADEERKAKRRAALAVLLASQEAELASEWLALRKRYDALLDILMGVGCAILRRGTIEDYYAHSQPSNSLGRPEEAATEMEAMAALSEQTVRETYGDIVRAIELAAPAKKVDENALLREQLGSLLGAALQIVRPGVSDEELNARAKANLGSSTTVFSLANKSVDEEGGPLCRVEVHITSPLFEREGFPFEIGVGDNPTAKIAEKLPSI